MAGESGKTSRKASTGKSAEESISPGRQSATGSPKLAASGRNAFRSADGPFQQEDRTSTAQIFKKPKMDASPDAKDSVVFGDTSGSSASGNVSSDHGREGSSRRANDIIKAEIAPLLVSGDCSTCGDVGFPAELFVCKKCGTRRQHTYCSNSYHPRKRWFLRLCNWCEAENVELSNGGNSKQNPGMSKRDTWSGGRSEKGNAVDCLLGAALRLPTAGFSCVEDLLQVDSNASSSAKRRKPPSFDSVEKARRSGLSGDVYTVKSLKRPVPASLVKSEACPGSTGEVQKSPNSSVDNGGGRSPSIGSTPTWRMKRSCAAGGDSAAVTPTSSVTLSARDNRAQRSDIRNRAELGNLDACAGRASSCDSSEKHDRNNCNLPTTNAIASVGEKANLGLSPNASRGRSLNAKSPKSPSVSTAERTAQDGRASAGLSSPETDGRMKRSSGAGLVEHVQRATRTASTPRSELKENASKNSKLNGTSRPREHAGGSDAPSHKRTRVDSPDKQKKSSLEVSLEKSGSDRISCDGEDDIATSSRSCVGLRSENANVAREQPRAQVQKSTAYNKDFSTTSKKSGQSGTSGAGSKQQIQQPASTPGRHTARLSVAAGKTAGSPTLRNSANAEEKSHQKRSANPKDSSAKVRRSSTKMPGFHNNYKSLSDILC